MLKELSGQARRNSCEAKAGRAVTMNDLLVHHGARLFRGAAQVDGVQAAVSARIESVVERRIVQAAYPVGRDAAAHCGIDGNLSAFHIIIEQPFAHRSYPEPAASLVLGKGINVLGGFPVPFFQGQIVAASCPLVHYRHSVAE